VNGWEEVTVKMRQGTYESWSASSLPTCSVVSIWRDCI